MILEPRLYDVLFHFLLTVKNVTEEEKQDTEEEGAKVSDASTQGHQKDVTFAAASPSDRPQPPTEPPVSAHTHPPAACAKIQSLLYRTRWVVCKVQTITLVCFVMGGNSGNTGVFWSPYLCTCLSELGAPCADSVCLSQDHKYVVRAEVLYKSWQLDEAEVTFVQQLRESQRNEMKGEVNSS